MSKAREVALTTLEKVLKQGAYSNLQLNQTLTKTSLSDADKRLVTNLVYGVLQHKLTLEYWLTPFIAQKKKSRRG